MAFLLARYMRDHHREVAIETARHVVETNKDCVASVPAVVQELSLGHSPESPPTQNDRLLQPGQLVPLKYPTKIITIVLGSWKVLLTKWTLGPLLKGTQKTLATEDVTTRQPRWSTWPLIDPIVLAALLQYGLQEIRC